MSKNKKNDAPRIERIPIKLTSDPVEFEKQWGYKKEDVNILFYTPAYGGQMFVPYVQSCLSTQMLFAKIGLNHEFRFTANESLITRARNTGVAYFLSNPKFTHLMFIDADINWNPISILSMVGANKDVVSGIYPKKGYNFAKLQPLIDSKIPGALNEINTKLVDYAVNFKDHKNVVRDGNCVEVKDAPTGFMLIKRETILTLIKENPTLRYNNDLQLDANQFNPENFWLFFDCIKDPDDGRYLSEDYAFCRLVQKANMTTWADLTVQLSHTGTHNFVGNISNLFKVSGG
jgi:hypothetical protein